MSNFSGKNYTKTHDENSNNENQDQIKENIPLNKSSNKKITPFLFSEDLLIFLDVSTKSYILYADSEVNNGSGKLNV